MSYYIQNIRISLVESNRKIWNRLTREKLRRQFDGFKEEGSSRYKINIRDIAEINLKKVIRDMNMVSNLYGYKSRNDEECFYVLKKKTLLIKRENSIDLYIGKNYSPALTYLINWFLMKEGRTFVHSAAFERNNKGYLFCAFEGVGKTALIAEASNNDDIKVLGDDLNIVGEDEFIYPYPRPFCIYNYHKKLFPDYFRNHPTYIPRQNFINRVLRRLSREVGNIRDWGYIPISPQKIIGRDKLKEGRVPLEEIFILSRKQSNVFSFEKGTVEYAVNFTASVMQYEWKDTLYHMLVYHALSGFSFNNYLKKYKEIIYRNFRNKKITLVSIPNDYDSKETASKILEVIN